MRLLMAGAAVQVPLAWQPTAFSVSWWVYADQGTVGNFTQAVGASLDESDPWSGFLFHTTSTGRIYVGTDQSTWLETAQGTFEEQKWQHFTFTFNRGAAALYKGDYRGDRLIASRSGMTMPAPWRNLALGSTVNQGLPAAGYYDDLRVYDRALTPGEAALLTAGTASVYTPPSAPADDLNRNWTVERTYDGSGNDAGNILAESKQFTDGLGRATQAQARSRANPHVFASETLYSSGGQPVGQTLAAPTNNQAFAYKEQFVAVNPTAPKAYDYTNFEGSKAANPDGLDVRTLGTLGYYYSTDNQLEPLTPATDYPFSLATPAEGPLGGLKRAGAPGEAFRLGSGHEAKGREIPLLNEFDHYTTLRHHFVPGSNNAVPLRRQGTKSIRVDADGRESIVVANKEGQALVSCLTGAQYPAMPVSGFISTDPTRPDAPAFLDIHIPATGEHPLTFTMSGRVRILNLNGGAGVSLTSGSGYLDSVDVAVQTSTSAVAYLLPGFYRLVSLPGATAADQTQGFNYSAEYGNFSYTYYDDAGRAVATVAPNGLAGNNLVKDPSFDESPQPGAPGPSWQTLGDGGAVFAEAFGGPHTGALHGTHYRNAAYYAFTHQVIANIPNGHYTLQAWVKGSGGQNKAFLLARNFGGLLYTTIPATPNGPAGAWTLVKIDDIVVSTGQCDIGFESDAGPNQFIYFDDVVFARKPGDEQPPTTASTQQTGHWALNEGTGLVTGDESGNGLTGTLVGTPAWSTAAAPAGIPASPAGGSCLVFNGSNYVRIGDPPALRMGTTLSIEAWIYPTLDKQEIIVNKEYEYEVARFPDGSIRCYFNNATAAVDWVSTTITAPLNTWTHIALTYDNGVVTAYLNGVASGTTYQGSGAIIYRGGELWIGSRQLLSYESFVGAIDEVRIWNSVHVPNSNPTSPASSGLQYVTRSTYNTTGQLLSTENNEAGRTDYVYAKDGRIRFSQSALQRATGRFSYSNYDEVGRVVESGEYTPAGTTATTFQPQTPLRTVYEAEASTDRGGGAQALSTGSGFHSTGFVGSFNQVGAQVGFNVTVPATGTYSVRIRYAAGDPTFPYRSFPLYVQNAQTTGSGYVGHQYFPTTWNWNRWDEKTVELALVQGANRLLFQVDRAPTAQDQIHEGYVSLDYLEVVSEQMPTSTSVLNLLEERMPINALAAANCNQRNLVVYDEATTVSGRLQEFTNGAVSKTQNDNVTTWYSYDEAGRVTWMVQDFAALGVKSLDYTYDPAGNVLKVAYQQGQPDAFYHHYEYDGAQRLFQAFTSTDGTARTLQAKYYYYLHGPLKRVELAEGLQGMDYTYTLQGWLKGINHVNGRLDPGGDSPAGNGRPKDLFGLTLDYFSGDYQSRAQAAVNLAGSSTAANPFRYDGTIRTASWRTAGSAENHQSVYAYDAKSQLAQSTFGALAIAGTPANSTYLVTPSQAYREGGLSYDANGNLQALHRTDKAGSVTDNFRYEYTPGTNRLSAVHGGGSPTGTTVLDYDYDALGQMTRQRDEQGQRYLTYDVTGKTTGVYLDAAHQQAVVEFAYDDKGFRVSKKSYGTGTSAGQVRTTYYVRDASGNVLSIYEQGAQTNNVVQRSEVPLYGSGRVGVLTHLDDGTTAGTDDYRYELNDHLGDARVVFHRPTTTTVTASCELTREASQENDQWQDLDPARHYFGKGAHQGVTTPSDYVAHVAPPVYGGQSEGPRRTVTVEKGDTLTFSSWVFLEHNGIIISPEERAARLHLIPVLTPSSALALPAKDGVPTSSPGLLNRLTAGVALVGWGGRKPVTPAMAARTTGTRVWLRYRVYDENKDQIDEQYLYLNNATAQTWQALQTAVRVQQAGTVEVTVGTDDPNYDVYFDDLRLEQTGGMIVQEQHQYAYGSPLVGLNYAVGNKRYRYGYQGQYAEKDGEIGFESFELRLYNSRIGRWASYDPEGQFDSPYVGMGNNPVSQVDPDGGLTCCGGGGPVMRGNHIVGFRGVAKTAGATVVREGSSQLLKAVMSPILQASIRTFMNSYPSSIPKPIANTSKSPLASGYYMPVGGQLAISDEYNRPRTRKNGSIYTHGGLDETYKTAGAIKGQNITPILAGRVIKAVHQLDGNSGGIRVNIQSNTGLVVRYMHMMPGSNSSIINGQWVTPYTVIGRVGHSTGMTPEAPGIHLHIETLLGGERVDPGLIVPEFDALPAQRGSRKFYGR
ncbi:LamG-like jellyroll fold domain-containing protein [Hymenobacter artigasi]|uniref:RHS repeat-associated protein n=1 Tax=Hymenobacter artigasi TaxID=2719616 RepID=A0ABX1HR72_9BACT|nr:LamG-like jellyroll fold domain-containing protein [Hymenobacter artigasi]NKI91892.1 RHS repeat-associated protein [Hymenobacter artigasi]